MKPTLRRRAAVATIVLLGLAGAAAGARELAVCADPNNLPYSNERLEGFENRIAELLADELGASLRYGWGVQRRSFLRRTLNAKECDVALGLPVGMPGVVQTRPYYASTYAFVTRRGGPPAPRDFDDPALTRMRIGLLAVGAEGANPPPAAALAARGLSSQVVGFRAWGETGEADPQARVVDAVRSGEVDVAVVWGPQAGYFSSRHGGSLQVTPVDADPLQPAVPFRFEIAMSVRRGDEALRDELQAVLDRRGDAIRRILETYGVPLAARPGGTMQSTGE